MKNWKIKELKCWRMKVLKNEVLKKWGVEEWKCWRIEVLQNWSVEELECQRIDVLKNWSYKELKHWSEGYSSVDGVVDQILYLHQIVMYLWVVDSCRWMNVVAISFDLQYRLKLERQ